jgi:hypothetical protein
MLLSDYITQVQGLVHDDASIDFSQTAMTYYVNAARKRVALDFHCVRTFFPGSISTPTNPSAGLISGMTTIAGKETYPITGGVGGVTLTNGGVYAVAPTVTFGAPGGGGTTATGNVIMGGTAPNLFVQQVQMTNWGSGYVSTPTVTFSSGAAAATAIAMTNIIDLYQLTAINGVQRTTMQSKVFGAFFQPFFRSNLMLTGQPVVFSHVIEQNLFYLYPIPDQSSYILEIDAIAEPVLLVNLTDTDTQVIDPVADCVQFYAAHLALYKLQNFDQAEKMEQKYKRRAKEVFGTRYAPRMPNVYQTGWRRIQRGW